MSNVMILIIRSISVFRKNVIGRFGQQLKNKQFPSAEPFSERMFHVTFVPGNERSRE